MTAPSTLRVRLSALLGLLAIILGSMGAHGSVHDMLVGANELDHWKTASFYHLSHAVLAALLGANEIIIAGGGDIYRAFLDLTDVIELTEVALDIEGDAHFPALDPQDWREIAREAPPRGPKDEADFAYVTLERRRS